jgi:hypothetical protein
MKTTYKCKKCHWEKSIMAAWGDIKPKMCPVPRCLTNFLADPDSLEVTVPTVVTPHKVEKQEQKSEPKQYGFKKDKKDNRDE